MKETILLLLVALVQSESDGTRLVSSPGPLSLGDIFQATDPEEGFIVEEPEEMPQELQEMDIGDVPDEEKPILVGKRSQKESLTRRSALDKNFMRFGKRSGPSFFPDGEVRLRNLMRFTRSGGAKGNFIRFGRGKQDNFMRFGRGGDNFMRFGRPSNDNFMRFGRKSDNFMRFGKAASDNFMRFGRPSDNFMRFGRKTDNFMRFGRPSNDNFMRFGRKSDNFMRFGKSSKDNFMRFGKAAAEGNSNFIRFGRGGSGEEAVLSIERSLGLDNGTEGALQRFGRDLEPETKEEHEVTEDGDTGDLELSADKMKQGPILRAKREAEVAAPLMPPRAP